MVQALQNPLRTCAGSKCLIHSGAFQLLGQAGGGQTSYRLLCGQQQGVDVLKSLELRLVYSLDDVPEETHR